MELSFILSVMLLQLSSRKLYKPVKLAMKLRSNGLVSIQQLSEFDLFSILGIPHDGNRGL